MVEAFAELQQSFTAAVLGQPVELPIRAATAARAESGLAVHRNNVTSSLVKVVAARFPAVRRLLGEDRFLESVRRFIVAEPPRSPLLLDYGDGFPEFLRRLGDGTCIADIAELEVARGKAYHAADATSLPPQAFAAISTEQLAGLRLTFHPSVSLLQSRFPIVSLWQANQDTGDVVLRKQRPEAALIARPLLEVEVWNLPPGGFAFLSALRRGATMAEATEAAMDAAPEFDLAVNLLVLIKARIVTGLAH
ncbi:HvfC/BufC family peptide modification chaperone [Bradyrhizobium sp.]